MHVFTNINARERRDRELGCRAREHRAAAAQRLAARPLRPGDAISVTGPTARNGSRQLWGETVISATATNRQVYNVTDLTAATAVAAATPAARRQAAARSADEIGGYWAYPSSMCLMQAVRTCR